MVEAHRKKICLSISQIKCNNKKTPSFLGMKFFTAAIFSRRHAAIFLRAPLLSLLLSYKNCRNMRQTSSFAPDPSIKKERERKKKAQLCACGMSGAPLGHSWNPETRILLLSQQEESGLGRHKRGHSQSWWGKRVKPVELQTQRLRGFLSSRWKGIRVFFYLFIWARSSTEPDLKCWQISFEKNRASVCNSNCLTTVYPPTTPQCQRQALSLKLHSSDPFFFFFFSSGLGGR